MTFTPSQLNSQQHFLIVGFGVTGQAVARFLSSKNTHYSIIDDKNLSGGLWLNGEKLQTETGAAVETKFTAAIVSPGIPPEHAALLWCQKNQIPLIGETELAAHFLTGKLIGVTGTNGKSTTVKLIDALLTGAGISTGLKGNIGDPLITAVSEPAKDWYVIEESSYQTEQIQNMHHHIVVCLNVTDDHFDRYPNLATYAAAKAKILSNMTEADTFIFNADDPSCLKMSWTTSAQKYPYSLVNQAPLGAFVRGYDLILNLQGQEINFPLSECALKGLHNFENMMAALLTVCQIKSDTAAIAAYRSVLRTFKGLPHRVEKIHEENGVTYYDDSKGTNVGSVVMALASFSGNVLLIAGGKDKLGDYAPLKGLVQNKVKTLILLGEAKERMHAALGDQTHTVLVSDMREAVSLAKCHAKPGDTVLLSPACSSFDQYLNYHERGLDFQRWAKES